MATEARSQSFTATQVVDHYGRVSSQKRSNAEVPSAADDVNASCVVSEPYASTTDNEASNNISVSLTRANVKYHAAFTPDDRKTHKMDNVQQAAQELGIDLPSLCWENGHHRLNEWLQEQCTQRYVYIDLKMTKKEE
ncbi:hypothetical protein BDV96DRAFT_607823 [Lophiotrema nucula]|uniref:Uncharacterized protein n=1 Tax=Lophiotrema nucula TaxID=690887 RepID=A0A6A5YG36_9PLEO|nr:hypothetical protein BDV96DRAFT_607823 [Lophiotrema nucula]